ncbi:preprotein translocase subunit SecG [Coralloluteibacterium thermophilus]|uniref:Protein-export membrane protein SecG n=1 Tax=Coralloluteibacterium thermophilum TaxID=2707049 RepID=A0ABV9NJF3_9GAMM
MLLTLANILYVLVSAAMIVLILMQRGAGAAAGSGFGGGASATVFGARGASNFLSKSTKWLAIAFFAISLGMAWYAARPAGQPSAVQDLGIMGAVPAMPAQPQGAVPAMPAQPQGAVPAPAGEVPAVPAAPAQVEEEVPAAGQVPATAPEDADGTR